MMLRTRIRGLRGAALAIAAALAWLWVGLAGAGRGTSGQTVSELLSGIDFVPSRPALDDAMGATAPEELIAIAVGSEPDLDDPGLRIRAYRALGLYPSPATEEALRAALLRHGTKVVGVEVLYLRAAMDSLARVAGPDAVDAIGAMLGHPSRDVRADAARALGLTRSDRAACYLRPIQGQDVPQVKVAVDEALREVGDCPPLEPGPPRDKP